jgi:mono/diheme cytochrome c family protein
VSPVPMMRPTLSCCVGALCLTLLALSCAPPAPPTTRTETGEPDGARIYQSWCAGCHGIDGSLGAEGVRLREAHEKPREEIRRVIEEGRGQMPAWRNRLAEDEIEAVVDHVHGLGQPPP